MTWCQLLWNISLVFSSCIVCSKRLFLWKINLNKYSMTLMGWMSMFVFFFNQVTPLLFPQDHFKSWFFKNVILCLFSHACFLLSNAILFITYNSICLIGLNMRRQTATLLSTLSTFRNVHFAYWFFEASHFLICKAGRVHSFRCLSVTALPLMLIGCFFDHLLEVSKYQGKQPRGILVGSQCRLKNILAPCLLVALYFKQNIQKTLVLAKTAG